METWNEVSRVVMKAPWLVALPVKAPSSSSAAVVTTTIGLCFFAGYAPCSYSSSAVAAITRLRILLVLLVFQAFRVTKLGKKYGGGAGNRVLLLYFFFSSFVSLYS